MLKRLVEQKESRIEEGHLMPDRAHMLISIPPNVCDESGDWVHQGRERNPLSAGVRGAQVKFRGAVS